MTWNEFKKKVDQKIADYGCLNLDMKIFIQSEGYDVPLTLTFEKTNSIEYIYVSATD
jgi:hypothetical protein